MEFDDPGGRWPDTSGARDSTGPRRWPDAGPSPAFVFDQLNELRAEMTRQNMELQRRLNSLESQFSELLHLLREWAGRSN